MKCLKKNPKERANITQLTTDPWLTRNGSEPLVLATVQFPNVDKEEVDGAIAELKKDKSTDQ